MIIGVNTRFLLKNKMEGFGWYTYETISRIVKKHPEHQFILFFDRAYDEKFVFAKNVTPVVLHPQARHPLLFKIWFNYSITKALKKYNCDGFISPDGYLSLRTSVPQLAVIHDLNFEHNPDDIPPRALKYLTKYFPLFAQKANRICTVSNYSKEDIISTYGIDSNKIDVTYNGAAACFRPISSAENKRVQVSYSEGKPFLLFVGALHKRKNIQRLLDAFSELKSTTNHPHHLVIVGEKLWDDHHFHTPKAIKEFVHYTGHIDLEELARITAAADLMTFVSYFEGFGIPLLEAMQSGTPVLAGNKTALPEIGRDAVQYCDPFSVEDIAHQLNYLLSSPKVLEEMKDKGLHRAQHFSWNNTAEQLWKSFEEMMSQHV
jgi:glycosyltransferase involved in cell wall biosynthesis